MSKPKGVRKNTLPAGERYAPGDKHGLNSQKGFTLIELLAVMAIIGILAAVVFSNVDDSQQAGEVAANRQSASAIDSAVVDFVAAQSDVEILSSATVTVVTKINEDSVASTTQQISSRRPELFITSDPNSSSTAIYFNEFPTSGATTEGVVVNVILLDSDGSPISREDFLEGHTAIDVALLEDLGFLADDLESASSLVADDFHNFMWTFAKIGTSGSIALDGRRVEVFKLQTITEFSDSEGGSTLPGVNSIQLRYEQIF